MEEDPTNALRRAVRVADQSCTAYSILRDRFTRWARYLDLSILLISAWLISMVFVEPAIGLALSPRSVPKDIWIGLLSIGAFCLSLVQLQVNWKGRGQAYGEAVTVLSNFVKEQRPFIPSVDTARAQEAVLRYRLITEKLEAIPEAQFLRLKRKHKLKILFSRHLDTHPGSSLLVMRVIVWWRDNRQSVRDPNILREPRE